MNIQQLKELSPEDQKRVLRTMPFKQVLDLAVQVADELLVQVQGLECAILDGMETRLATDTASKEVAAALQARLQGLRR